MGYIRHHAIVVTSYSDEYIGAAHAHAADIFPTVSPIFASSMNGYRSFFIPPDGSKEGWTKSKDGDSQRDSFIEWLYTMRFEDNGTPLSWAEIQYGDDDLETIVTRDSDMPVRERWTLLQEGEALE